MAATEAIKKIILENVTKKWRINFKFDRKNWDVSIESENGRVTGNADTNVATSDLSYFQYDFKTRSDHFESFKKHIKIQEAINK